MKSSNVAEGSSTAVPKTGYNPPHGQFEPTLEPEFTDDRAITGTLGKRITIDAGSYPRGGSISLKFNVGEIYRQERIASLNKRLRSK